MAVRLPAKAVGQEQLAARVQVAVADAVVAQGLVKAMWSNDDTLTTRIDPAVAHYTGQAELAEAIQDGLAAKAAGDTDTATVKLGRAVQLAAGDRQRGGDDPAAQDRRDRQRRHRHRAPEAQRQQARRDGARHGIHQDDPGEEVTRPCATSGRGCRRLAP